MLNSFTWSKAIDNVSQVLEEPGGSTGTPQNVYDIDNDRGPVRLRRAAAERHELRVEPAVRAGPASSATNMGTLLNGILGGWQVSGIHTMRSGRTVNLRYNTSGPTAVTSGLPTFLGGVNLRPNVIGDPLAPEDRAFDRQLLQPRQHHAAAGDGAVRQRRPQHRPRLRRSISSISGIQKQFALPFRNGGWVEIRAEGFNVLNKTNFGLPERRSQQRRVRHHPLDVPGPSDAVRGEGQLLASHCRSSEDP